jgi:hypothetical protein
MRAESIEYFTKREMQNAVDRRRNFSLFMVFCYELSTGQGMNGYFPGMKSTLRLPDSDSGLSFQEMHYILTDRQNIIIVEEICDISATLVVLYLG